MNHFVYFISWGFIIFISLLIISEIIQYFYPPNCTISMHKNIILSSSEPDSTTTHLSSEPQSISYSDSHVSSEPQSISYSDSQSNDQNMFLNANLTPVGPVNNEHGFPVEELYHGGYIPLPYSTSPGIVTNELPMA